MLKTESLYHLTRCKKTKDFRQNLYTEVLPYVTEKSPMFHQNDN